MQPSWASLPLVQVRAGQRGAVGTHVLRLGGRAAAAGAMFSLCSCQWDAWAGGRLSRRLRPPAITHASDAAQPVRAWGQQLGSTVGGYGGAYSQRAALVVAAPLVAGELGALPTPAAAAAFEHGCLTSSSASLPSCPMLDAAGIHPTTRQQPSSPP